MIEIHLNQSAPIKGLQKADTYNPFSEESKKVIHNLGNVEYFELCEMSPKTQWRRRLLYLWDLFDTYRAHEAIDQRDIRHIVHCVFFIKKWSCRGARYGKTDDQREYNQAKTCSRKALRLNYNSIFEAFKKHDTYRESQLALGWTEDTCTQLDLIAKEDTVRRHLDACSECARTLVTYDKERRLLRSWRGNPKFAPQGWAGK